MNSLSKFDGNAIALSTVYSLQKQVPRFGLKDGEAGKVVNILLTQSRTNKAGEVINTGFPLSVEVKKDADFARTMGAVFTYVRKAIGRMGINKAQAVNLALSVDGQTVSTSQIQYGGVKGRAFLPGVRKDETHADYMKRANDAFREASASLVAQLTEVLLPETLVIDEALEGRMKALMNG